LLGKRSIAICFSIKPVREILGICLSILKIVFLDVIAEVRHSGFELRLEDPSAGVITRIKLTICELG